MKDLLSILYTIVLILISITGNSQSAEIIKLEEKNTYQYNSYYEDGSIKSIIGFYTKKPYSSIKVFEEKLDNYKIKYHGDQKEYYSNGQLKEIVVYKKGKVIEFAKNYFEDGEEYSVVTDERPQFQFVIGQQNAWFNKRIKEIESKYEIDLKGTGIIALEIGKSGTIKSIKVRISDKNLEKYLIEIGQQIEVVKPAKKNGKEIGTRFGFKIEL